MRIGICDCSNQKIVYMYEAPEPTPSKFGGKWGRSICKHLPFDESIPENTPLSNLKMDIVQVQVGTQRVPDGDPRIAKDDDGQPMEDQDGNPIMVQDHKMVPVFEDQLRIILK